MSDGRMTSPAAIAQRLTPAQVRALKNPNQMQDSQMFALRRVEKECGDLVSCNHQSRWTQTTLGKAVLTELERMGK